MIKFVFSIFNVNLFAQYQVLITLSELLTLILSAVTVLLVKNGLVSSANSSGLKIVDYVTRSFM